MLGTSSYSILTYVKQLAFIHLSVETMKFSAEAWGYSVFPIVYLEKSFIISLGKNYFLRTQIIFECPVPVIFPRYIFESPVPFLQI